MAQTKIYVNTKGKDDLVEYTVDEAGSTSWYWQRTSLNSFWKRYNFMDKHKHYSFDWHHREDKVVKSVYCESVWLFYKRVGYDYKTKKFVEVV